MGWGSVPCWGTAEAKTERDEDVWTFRRMEERPGWKARLERVPGIEAELFGFCPEGSHLLFSSHGVEEQDIVRAV